MANSSKASYEMALRDFHEARRQAVMQQMLARLRGEEDGLLRFQQVQEGLHATGVTVERGLVEIPLDKIVGSVDRHQDFTRSFLPKSDADLERWTGVRAAVNDMVGMPPIDVYQIGDVYFVQDGNHRVSIARTLGTKTISAHVTEIETRVPLNAGDDLKELICKSRYADFLAQTNLDKLRPNADLMLTYCGEFEVLLEQIAAVQKMLDQKRRQKGEIWARAVTEWYDQVYMPVIRIIRELGVLRRFPERTEGDLYVLLSERRDELERELGWRVDLETGVSGLLSAAQTRPGFMQRVRRIITPAPLSEPPAGLWRQQQLARQRYHHLFEHILVPLDGSDDGWRLFDFIVDTAQFDGDHILGLHVVAKRSQITSPAVLAIEARFNERCREVGLAGEFAVEVDKNVGEAIVRRSAWADFVIVRGHRPPDNGALTQITPNLRMIIEHCPRPIQVRPDGTQSDSSRGLLAYDGSPKADEALFVATYLTARWPKALTVVTVETAYTKPSVLDRAREYLERHDLHDVNYVLGHGPIAETVLQTARDTDSNLLFMGGFSFPSLRNLNLGSSAERILRQFQYPIWICR